MRWSLLAVALGACAPDLAFSEAVDVARVGEIYAGMGLPAPTTTLEGPWAVGSEAELFLARTRGSGSITRFVVRSTDTQVVQVAQSGGDTGAMDVWASFVGPGAAALSVQRATGRQVERLDVEAMTADAALLRVWDDHETGRQGRLEPGDTLHLLASARLALVAVPVAADGTPLRGVGAVRVQSDDPGAVVQSPADRGPAGLETVQVELGDAVGASTLVVDVDRRQVRFPVVVHAPDEVDGIELELSDDERFLRARVTVGEDRVSAPMLEWSFDGDGPTTFTWVEWTPGGVTRVRVCVPGTEICDEGELPGARGSRAGDALFGCGCRHAGGGAAWAALLVWAARRRRGAPG